VRKIGWEENRAAGIVLVQALAKGGRDEMAVEAAVGLGVERVVPWAASRSIAKWPGPRADRGRSRWQAIARAESKVARRAWLADVEPLTTTAQLANSIRSGALVLVLHEAATSSFASHARALAGRAGVGVGVTIVVGPEGGIGEDELEVLVDAGATPVVLGDEVLRSSAAAPAALAALAALRGAWG
jgi:16S rRNA (uracil1498-N3)-methyltransferase